MRRLRAQRLQHGRDADDSEPPTASYAAPYGSDSYGGGLYGSQSTTSSAASGTSGSQADPVTATSSGKKVDGGPESRLASASAENAYEKRRAVTGTRSIDWKLLVAGVALILLGMSAFVVASYRKKDRKPRPPFGQDTNVA
jgi:hypothetical protein